MIEIKNCDCMELLRSIPDKSIDLVVTDPPYILDTNGGGCFGPKNRTFHSELAPISKGCSTDVLDEMLRVLKVPNMYLWGNWNLILDYLDYFRRERETPMLTNILCWHKLNPVPMCSNKFLTDTEYCLFARVKGVKLYGGYEDHKTHWETPLNTTDKKAYGHPTVKPLPIIETMLRNSSLEGQTVLDPYLGSGTTALACKKLNRNFIGSEINETYYQTALRRVNNEGNTESHIKIEDFEGTGHTERTDP